MSSALQYTRKQYMDGECTHEEYYAQFATARVVTLVHMTLGEQIRKSTDRAFNDIPLARWDQLANALPSDVVSLIEDANASTYAGGARAISLADKVCTLKAAARIIRGLRERQG